MKGPSLVLLIALAFASGAASGFVVARAPAAPQPVARGRRQVAEEIVRLVQPDDEQRRKLEEILERNHPRFVEVRRRVEPDLAAIRSDVRAQIRAILDPEARAKFDAYCARRDEARAAQNE